MNISDIITGEDVLSEAFTHPHLKVTSRTKKFPDIDKAMGVVEKTIQLLFARTVAGQIIPALTDTYQRYVLLNGEHEEAENKPEWESGMDDQVEALIEAYVPHLSADWLGNHTIDCGIHLDDGINKFCMSLGKEFFKQLTYQKSPAKIMSNTGITKNEVEMWLNEHIETNRGSKKENETMTTEDEPLAVIVAKIKAHIGDDHDVMAVYDDLDLVSDMDDILAQGAAPRLGLQEPDIQHLQALRFQHEDKTPEVIYELVKAVESETKPKKKATAKKAKPAAKKKEKQPEEGEMLLDSDMLLRLKEYGGVGDKDMAEALGLSRATYNKWTKGQGERTVDEEGYNVLRQRFVTHLNELHLGLAALDGTEAHVVS